MVKAVVTAIPDDWEAAVVWITAMDFGIECQKNMIGS